MNRRQKTVLAAVVLLLAGAAVGLAVRRHRHGSAAPGAAAAKYYCPMHPTYTSDRPGECPICNMTLVPMESADASSPAPAADHAAGHPQRGAKFCVLHKCGMADCRMEMPVYPGQKISCPVCGSYIAEAPAGARPVYWRHPVRSETTSPEPKKAENGEDFIPVYAEGLLLKPVAPELATVTVSPERQQLIGLKSEPAATRELSSTVRASGRVAYDPDLYNAITEYREAVATRARLEASPEPEVQARAAGLVRASELRLRQMGLSAEQIRGYARASESPTNLLLGTGGGTVWVYAQVYEHEISRVKPGQTAVLTSPAFPGKTFRGTVRSLDSILSPETRSLKVRIEVPNPDGALKLEMYVDAAIEGRLGKRLAVPESAVLDTGARKVAFVDLGGGRLEPRELVVGAKADRWYEVLSGVKEGEKVVTSANFLIDAESRLRAALGTVSPKKEGASPPEGHRH